MAARAWSAFPAAMASKIAWCSCSTSAMRVVPVEVERSVRTESWSTWLRWAIKRMKYGLLVALPTAR
ncbi:hypothetical protein D3C72_2150800 [compost metagenome]